MRNDSTITSAQLPPTPSEDLRQQNVDKDKRHRYYNRPLKIRRVPMRHGWFWLIEGFMLWARSPAFLGFLAFSALFVWVGASWYVPYVGELLATILYPGLLLGVFNGCRAIDRKRTLSPGLLISGFRRHAFDLLFSGFCSFIVMAVILLSTWPIDGGMMWGLVMYGRLPETTGFDFVSSPLFYSSIYIGLLSTLWTVIYLFVPQLIGWWRVSVPSALMYSLKGCLRNWMPLLTYTICFCFFIITPSYLIINFLQLAAEGLGAVVCAVFLIIVSPALIASFYVAARDIFGFPRRRKHKQRPPNPPAAEQKNRRVRA